MKENTEDEIRLRKKDAVKRGTLKIHIGNKKFGETAGIHVMSSKATRVQERSVDSV